MGLDTRLCGTLKLFSLQSDIEGNSPCLGTLDRAAGKGTHHCQPLGIPSAVWAVAVGTWMGWQDTGGTKVYHCSGSGGLGLCHSTVSAVSHQPWSCPHNPPHKSTHWKKTTREKSCVAFGSSWLIKTSSIAGIQSSAPVWSWGLSSQLRPCVDLPQIFMFRGVLLADKGRMRRL